MFIAIVGTRSAGKSTVQEYLVQTKGFQPVQLVQNEDDSKQSESSDASSTTSRETDDVLLVDTAVADDSLIVQRQSFLSMASPISSSFPPSAVPYRSHFQHNPPLQFASLAQMLHHVTQNWRANFVTVDLNTRDALQTFVTRPFFMVVSVDGPLLTRFQRATRTRYSTPSLEEFVREHDDHFYGIEAASAQTPAALDESSDTPSLLRVEPFVTLRIVNSFNTIPALYAHLDALNLLNPQRLRPGWDAYFMQLAALASHRSNCMKRRVGAILVRNNRILATGYNGTPRGLTNCNEGGCARCNSGNETPDECLCLHAEENALLEAGRERVGDGAVLYCNTCPCLRCTIKIIQTGVKEVVYNLSYKVDDASAALFSAADVILRRHATHL